MKLLALASVWLLVAPLAMAGEAPPALTTVTVHFDRPAGRASALLYGLSLPAPGAPGAAALVPELLRNRSFEEAPAGRVEPMPEAWGKSPGWELRSIGPRLILARRELGRDMPLTLAGGRTWPDYHLSLLARKIGGPGGLRVLFDVQDQRNHVRWTLGASGNRQHVLESVGNGQPRLIAPPVVGRIEAGRCYRIDISLAEGVLQCSLDGHLVHQLGKTRFPHAGIGLGAADAAAEYFDIAVHAPGNRPLFLLDSPARKTLDAIADGWQPLRDPRNRVGYRWDWVYPLNSQFSQGIEVNAYTGGDAGICQGGIAVSAGVTYRGRVHLRAADRGVASVSLRGHGGRVTARQELGEPGVAWKGYEFALKPDASDPRADFCITVAGATTVWVDQVSLEAEGRAGGQGVREDAVAALRSVRPTVLRWPSGETADRYNWREGIGPRDERPVTSLADGAEASFEPASNDFGTDEFLSLCEEFGAAPLLVVNPRLGMRPALCWLEYCNGDASTPMGKLRAANGHPKPYGVRTWCIGSVWPPEAEIEAYAAAVAETAKAMREQDPSVRVIAWRGRSAASDGVLFEKAGSLLSHAAMATQPIPRNKNGSLKSDMFAGVGEFCRSRSAGLAVLDWAPGGDRCLTAGVALNALARSAGPEAIACLPLMPLEARAGERAVVGLFRANPLGELVQAEAPAGRWDAAFDAVAGRGDRGDVVVRLACSVKREEQVRIAIQGLGGRRLAARAVHHAIAEVGPRREPVPSREEVAVEGDAVTLSVKPSQPVHVVVVQLEGKTQ